MPANKNRELDPGPQATARAAFSFKIILVLLALVAAEGLTIAWLLRKTATAPGGFGFQGSLAGNPVQQSFPEVDFTAIYPGLSAAEIDRLQRDCFGLRYVYSPFVGFEPLPVSGPFVNISPAGFRKGRADAPWPPEKDDMVIFVFGGSTTFGYGLPDAQTVVSALEETLRADFPGRKVTCYNFGRGYYFSTQEHEFFASLLAQGIVPNLALFIDGLNDFEFFDGVPHWTAEFVHFTAGNVKVPARPVLADDGARGAAVQSLLNRYRQNVRLTEGIAQAFGVPVIFIGQPVPFFDFPRNPSTYPFSSTFDEHALCVWGYDRFREAALESRFGKHFVWCGDAFAGANSIMYADSIHYSKAGASALARCIAERARRQGLLSPPRNPGKT